MMFPVRTAQGESSARSMASPRLERRVGIRFAGQCSSAGSAPVTAPVPAKGLNADRLAQRHRRRRQGLSVCQGYRARGVCRTGKWIEDGGHRDRRFSSELRLL